MKSWSIEIEVETEDAVEFARVRAVAEQAAAEVIARIGVCGRIHRVAQRRSKAQEDQRKRRRKHAAR
jgi:hypothetical protein